MMKRAVLFLSAVAVLSVIVLGVYVQSGAFESRIRPLLAGPLQEVLGPGARFGRIKANLLPPYLEVRDIVVPSAKNPEAVAVRRIRIYLNPLPLIYRTVSIPSIAVLEPRVHAIRSEDGSVDLADLLRTIRSSMEQRFSPGPSAYDVHVRMVTVRSGKAVLHDAASKSVLTLSRADMKVKLSIPGPSLSVRLTGSELWVAAPAYREVRGRIRGSVAYDQGRLALADCELTTEDARLSVAGTIGVMTGGALDLKVSSRFGQRSLGRLTDLLARDKRSRGPVVELNARITGTLQDPLLSGGVTFSGMAFRDIRLQDAAARFSYERGAVAVSAEQWRLSRGDRQLVVQELSVETAYRESVLDVRRMHLKADDLSVSASGTIGPGEGYQIFLAAASSAAGRTLSFFAGFEISGAVSAQGVLSGPLNTPRFDGQLEAGPVSVRKVPFTRAAGEIFFRDRVLSLSSVDIRHGDSRYDFSGSMDLSGPETVYQARLNVLRSDVVSIVALFYERLPLDLSAKGALTFRGTVGEYSGEAQLDLGPGAAYGESFDRGLLTAALTTGRISFPRVLLEKKSGSVAGEGWIAFDGTYDAHVESEGVDLVEVDRLKGLDLAGPFVLDIRSSGRFSAPVVRAHAVSDALTYRDTAWGAALADLEIRDGVLACTARIERGNVALNGSWTLKRPYPWDLSAAVNVAEFEPSLLVRTSDVLSKIKVDAEGAIRLKGRGLDRESIWGDARLRTIGLTFGDIRIRNDREAVVAIEQGRVVFRSVSLTGPGTTLVVTGATTVGKNLDITVTGDASLSLLRTLYREIEHSDGAASVRLTVSDDWSNPEIAGDLTIRNGLIKVRDIPQKFTALNGAVSFLQGKIATEGLTGEIGGGTLTVTGNAQLDGAALVDFSGRAVIDNVTVRYPAGLTATVGGALYYDGDTATQTLSGEIAIRKAKFEKRIEWKSMLVDFSKGFSQKKKADIGWIGETQLNVRFVGKENVLFESNLAKIPLSVDMLFRGTVNQPQFLGRAEARKGEVYFRKNVFKILYASSDFTDPNRINPTLDVRAETKVREYTIQLGISGTADRAVVTFLSEPPLSDSDILAMLALGRKSDELKGKEATIGVSEATSFATGKFQDILESRARSLTGLDRFQVDPYISKTDVAVPRITVGKEVVQDKLIMTYSSNVGASKPEEVFRIEYLLNKNMSLVGERNELGSYGADVKFRFEFR